MARTYLALQIPAALFAVVCVVSAYLSIWTGSERWASTAFLSMFVGFIVSMVGMGVGMMLDD